MKREAAKLIIGSLIGRLISEGTAFQLPGGRLSKDEVTALKCFVDDSPAKTISENFEDKGNQTQSISINRNAFDEKGPPEEEIRMCLDFGTAMSKAWAVRGNVDDTIPLVLGRVAGRGDTLVVPSSIFISQSGQIYFGDAAERQHRQENDTDRKCFDNIKHLLNDAEVGQELDDVSLSPEIDPTESGLSKGYLLVLYLSWLTDIALKSLENKVDDADISGRLRYVRRRFAIPCFENAQDETVGGIERAKWATSIMQRALLRAQIVADTLNNDWDELTTGIAYSVLVQCRKIETQKLLHLLADKAPVREPVSAGASRFNDVLGGGIENISNDNIRSLLLVVDAGAGTTDFALFYVTEDEYVGARYTLVAPSVKMCRIAGNAIDDILWSLVLEACGINPETGFPRSERHFEIVKKDLNSEIRNIKRDLFQNAKVEINLNPNVFGVLHLDKLKENDRYKTYGNKLREIRDDIIQSVFGQFVDVLRPRYQLTPCKIYVLLTGGSSSLPIISALADGFYMIDTVAFNFSRIPESLPNWVNRLPRETADLLANWYPQCAVAIGGAVPELPEENKDLSEIILPAPPRPTASTNY